MTLIRITDEQKGSIVLMRQSGALLREIATAYGTSTTRVSAIYRQNGGH